MSISGAISHYGNTSLINKRYAKRADEINTRHGVIADAIDLEDKHLMRQKERKDLISYADSEGYSYDKDSDVFTVGDNKVSYHTFKAVKPFLESGIFNILDFDNPLLKVSEGPDNIKTTLNGEPALINQEEQNLINATGEAGEAIVAATGSGKIDPITGLPMHNNGLGLSAGLTASNYTTTSQYAPGNFNVGNSSFNSAVPSIASSGSTAPQGSSLLEIGNNALLAANPALGVLNIAAQEFMQAKNVAEQNTKAKKRLQQGVGVLENKIGSVEDDFHSNMGNLKDNLKSSFQDFSNSASDAVANTSKNVGKMIKGGKGLKTSAPENTIAELSKTIDEKSSINTERAFKDFNIKTEDLSSKTQDSIEDIGYSIKDMKYEIDTLEENDEWHENMFGGIFS